MKKTALLALLIVLAGAVSAERTPAPPPSPAYLSLSIVPSVTTPFGVDGSLGGGLSARQCFGQGWDVTLSCSYHPRPVPLYVGVTLGYAWVPYADWPSSGGNPFEAWYRDPGNSAITATSMYQAGLLAGIQLDIFDTAGIRTFGSAGCSYNVRSRNAGRSGTPFVGAGAELFWTFIPSLSLTAGVHARRFFDMYDEMAATLGLSYNLLAGRMAVKPAAPRAAPLQSPSSRAQTRPREPIAERLSHSLTPRHPAVLLLSRHISSSIEPGMNRALDRNLQSAIGIHHALRLLGIAFVSPTASYTTASNDTAMPGTAKLPLRTLQDGGGDCSDLSVLYCSLLGSAKVDTAFIAVPGHVFMAFALAARPDEARRMVGRGDKLLFRDGKAWVPVEVTEREGSFLAAWQTGAKEWQKAKKLARFSPVRNVGSNEPAASARSDSPPLPDTARLAAGFQQEVVQLLAQDIRTQDGDLMAAANVSGEKAARLNAMGLLFARADLFEKAETQFLAAVETGEYAPSLVNLGNLRLRNGLLTEAMAYYQRAAAAAPNDPVVLLGLARCHHELRNYDLSKQEYGELQKRSPALAAQFSYLLLQGEWAEAEAEAKGVKDVIVWDEAK